jgi:uncharacterized membrane protein
MAVVFLVCFFACVYAAFGLFQHWRFVTSAFDLGIFDQAVWHLSRFEAPASSISGHSNILGDHFYPIIALFAPLYWVAPAPETLIVAQSVLFAVSIVPVYLFLERRLPRRAALSLSTAYGLFWGMQRAAAFDVHEMAFAPLLVATAVLAADSERWRLFWPSALALTLVKEDLIPVLGFFGLYLFARGERRRGATLLVVSLLALVVVVGFAVPALNDAGRYGYAGTFEAVLRRPWTIPAILVSPPVKVQTFFMWLLPFLLLPLGSGLSVLIIPFVLTRFLSNSPLHWIANFHYSAPLAPILAMGAGDALAKIARRIDNRDTRRTVVAVLSGACVLFCAILPGGLPLWDLFLPAHYRATQVHRTGYRVVEGIPEGASVVAQAAVVPHLSQRPQVYMLDAKAPDADYVVAATDLSPWPMTDHADIAKLLEERRGRGYRLIFDENGWTVLRRE